MRIGVILPPPRLPGFGLGVHRQSIGVAAGKHRYAGDKSEDPRDVSPVGAVIKHATSDDGLEEDPRVQEQGVVGARVAAQAVIVRSRSIEPGVIGVLQTKL